MKCNKDVGTDLYSEFYMFSHLKFENDHLMSDALLSEIYNPF